MRADEPVKHQKKHRAPRMGAGKSSQPLYAALDLGTNSCRMLIATPSDDGRFEIVDAFSKSVKLGKELERTGALSSAAISRTLSALQVCAGKMRRHGVKRTRLVATEACRRAQNGEYFMRQVRRQTGLTLEVIKPQEEARLAVISCASLVDPDAEQVLVIDIGGGSTELVWLDISKLGPHERAQAMMQLRLSKDRSTAAQDSGIRVVDWISVPFGVATLHERFSDVDDIRSRFALMSCYFEDQMEEFSPYLELSAEAAMADLQMIGTSGTVTTIGAAHLGLAKYDRAAVDGMTLTAGEINAVIDNLLVASRVGKLSKMGVGLDRADLVMSGAAILQTLLRLWPTEKLCVADRGLREGMLYAMMGADGVLVEKES